MRFKRNKARIQWTFCWEYRRRVNRLMELDAAVPEEERIQELRAIEKMKREYKNKRSGIK